MGVQPTIMETILGILEQTMEYVVGTDFVLVFKVFFCKFNKIKTDLSGPSCLFKHYSRIFNINPVSLTHTHVFNS